MAEMQTVFVLLGTYAFSLFYSCLVMMQTVWRILRNGPKRFFYVKNRAMRPEFLDDPAFGTHGFARLKNLKLHYVAKGPEDKPLMLFIHGFPEFWYSWRHQMDEFSNDYRCVAFDMRGYNESDKPSSVSAYAMEHLVSDVKELIPALGYEKCTLVAHDWGGSVAWMFAWHYPDMVDQLICCNIPNPKAFEKHIKDSRSQFLKSWYVFFFQMPWLPELFMRSDDMKAIELTFNSPKIGMKNQKLTSQDLEAFKYALSGPGGITGGINFYRAALRYKPMVYPTDKVQVPALIVWGTADTALEKEMAPLSATYCVDCTIRYIEGASHWVQQDEPKKTNAFIRQFLEEKKTK